MAWIESHQSLSKHKKTIRTAGRLAVDRHKLIGHLHELWWWALDNVGVDGRMGDMEPHEIAMAAEWDGDPDIFVETLVDAGFLDRDDGEIYLHDWYDYAGKLIEARDAERERSRRRRAARKKGAGINQKTTAGQPAVNRWLTAGTQPNPTQQYSTVPNTKNICASDDARVCSDPQPGGSVEAEEVAATPEAKSGPRSPFKSKRQEQLFDEFWAQYPKKRSKGQAEKTWVKIKPDEQLFKAILDGLERAKTSVDWLKDDGQYIPYPATWLNAKGWEDDYTTSPTTPKGWGAIKDFLEDDDDQE